MTAPTIYRVGDDGRSHLLQDDPDTSEIPTATEAVANCPTGALSIEADET